MMYTLLVTSRKLQHYFQSHRIKAVSSFLWEISYAAATPQDTSSSGRSS
jgi:hypothetical protein